MSERGVFAVDRGVFDHDKLREDKAQFSKVEAWLWLLSSAAWKPHRRRVSGHNFDLQRGQLVASTRYMAERWRWTETRVRRFLTVLKTDAGGDAMIDARSDAGVTVITIRKYDLYQRVSLPNDAPTDAATIPPSDAVPAQERRNKEDTKDKEEVVGEDSRASLVSQNAQQIADELAEACGFPDPKNCPLGWYGAAAWVQRCLNEGWPGDVMIEGAKITAQRKRDGPIETFKYLEKPLARFIGEHARPLAKIEIPDVQTDDNRPSVHRVRSVPAKGGGLGRLRANLRAGQPSS